MVLRLVVYIGRVTLNSRLGQGKAAQCDSMPKIRVRNESVDFSNRLHSKRAATRNIFIWKYRDPAVVDAVWL
jgi:hypothetical protein